MEEGPPAGREREGGRQKIPEVRIACKKWHTHVRRAAVLVCTHASEIRSAFSHKEESGGGGAERRAGAGGL